MLRILLAIAALTIATVAEAQKSQQSYQTAGYCTTTCSGYGNSRTCTTYCY
jgi:hypothetical protein